MIAALQYRGITIFNPEIGLNLCDKARMGGHVYFHDTLNVKGAQKTQLKFYMAEFHPDLPRV
jgi:hypothetical protein